MIREKLIDTPVNHLMSLGVYNDYNQIIEKYRENLLHNLCDQQKFNQIIIKLIEELNLDIHRIKAIKETTVKTEESSENNIELNYSQIYSYLKLQLYQKYPNYHLIYNIEAYFFFRKDNFGSRNK
ncbi:MAG: hypothetical protein AB8U25_02850 [Rickettsiales endosymbiont of Dermacentor nuttalli]